MTYETVAVPVLPDDVWPASWAEVPGERFEREGTEYAVVSVPAGTEDPRIRWDLAPMYCVGGDIARREGCEISLQVVATCPHACPGTRGLWPVELAGRESCSRALVYPEAPIVATGLEPMQRDPGDEPELPKETP